jgi:hypothetical protein
MIDYPFSAGQALEILKHIGEYDHIEILDKELISDWTRMNTDDNFHQILNNQQINIEDDLKPEHEENVLGFAGYWWVFQYHAEHDHYLEYSERRKRWEFTTNSHNVTKWQPLPS